MTSLEILLVLFAFLPLIGILWLFLYWAFLGVREYRSAIKKGVRSNV